MYAHTNRMDSPVVHRVDQMGTGNGRLYTDVCQILPSATFPAHRSVHLPQIDPRHDPKPYRQPRLSNSFLPAATPQNLLYQKRTGTSIYHLTIENDPILLYVSPIDPFEQMPEYNRLLPASYSHATLLYSQNTVVCSSRFTSLLH